MQRQPSLFLPVSGCFIVLLLLQISPLSGTFQMWRPDFVLLLVIYVTQRRLIRFDVEFACLIGLMLDIVYGGILGKHAIAYSFTVYLLWGLRTQSLHLRGLRGIVRVFLLTILSQVLLYSVNALAQQSVSGSWILLPAFTTALAWPLAFQVMDRVVSRQEA